jgi:hypothetical protein
MWNFDGKSQGSANLGWNVGASPGGSGGSMNVPSISAPNPGIGFGWNVPQSPAPPLQIDPGFVGDKQCFVQEESFTSRELPKEMGIKFWVSFY